jgi:hypothetical protein
VKSFRLPVSGTEIILRQPTGAEDMLLMESGADDSRLAIALIVRMAEASDGHSIRWEDLPICDLDAVMLRIRQLIFGDLVRADIACTAPGCGKRIDIAFSVNQYLEHHWPRRARNAERATDDGWIRLRSDAISFRLPTGADQLAISSNPDPRRELIRRCIRPAEVAAAAVRRVERAMEAMAPSLAHELSGTCPECGAPFAVYFDPRCFTLAELRGQAAFFYEDAYLLAEQYHWSEAEILALPRDRRLRYTEMVRASRSAA